MKSILLITSLVLLTAFISCKKTEGEGGTSSIQGKVWVVNTTPDGDTIAEYYALDQDVFIIYGDDDSIYDDKFSTSLDGSYKFNNLTPGMYTIFVYSECLVCPSGESIVQRTVEITDKKQEIILEDIIILE